MDCQANEWKGRQTGSRDAYSLSPRQARTCLRIIIDGETNNPIPLYDITCPYRLNWPFASGTIQTCWCRHVPRAIRSKAALGAPLAFRPSWIDPADGTCRLRSDVMLPSPSIHHPFHPSIRDHPCRHSDGYVIIISAGLSLQGCTRSRYYTGAGSFVRSCRSRLILQCEAPRSRSNPGVSRQ